MTFSPIKTLTLWSFLSLVVTFPTVTSRETFIQDEVKEKPPSLLTVYIKTVYAGCEFMSGKIRDLWCKKEEVVESLKD